MDLGNQDMKKNSCKKYYKNILNKDYEEICDNKNMAFKSDRHTGKSMVEFENIDNYTYSSLD
jgi:hypothetical protein